MYPYKGKDQTCAFDESSATAVKVTTYTDVAKDSVDQMKAAVAKQPTSVSIEADKFVFQMYSSGIFDSAKCGTELDHATLVVGYGKEAVTGKEYWIMKNSWASSWGEDGYMKLQIQDGDGVCGIQMEPLYPTASE